MCYGLIAIQPGRQPSTGNYMRGIVLASVFWFCSAILAAAQEPANAPIIGWLSPATTESYHQPGPGNPGLQRVPISPASTQHQLMPRK
jgi:hypothetical protein